MLKRFRDYLELTKPRLTLLAVATTLAGFLLGARGGPDWATLCHTLIGTALVGAGLAALNQLLERRVDALMARTAARPLPAGRLHPVEALVFGTTALVLGLVELALKSGLLSAGLGAVTIVLYLFCYVPLKRLTPWCTTVGALVGAMPPLMGYAAATGRLDEVALVLFALLFTWQLPHFMAIATLYREEYRAAGMRMLTVVDPTGFRTARQIVVWSLALAVAALWPTYAGITGPRYLMGALLLGFVFGAFAFDAAVTRTRTTAQRLFLASLVYLPLLLSCIVVDHALS
jgi:protoheme IX farnesyltransferase